MNSKYKQNLAPDLLQKCLLNWVDGFAGSLGSGVMPLWSAFSLLLPSDLTLTTVCVLAADPQREGLRFC